MLLTSASTALAVCPRSLLSPPLPTYFAAASILLSPLLSTCSHHCSQPDPINAPQPAPTTAPDLLPPPLPTSLHHCYQHCNSLLPQRFPPATITAPHLHPSLLLTCSHHNSHLPPWPHHWSQPAPTARSQSAPSTAPSLLTSLLPTYSQSAPTIAPLSSYPAPKNLSMFITHRFLKFSCPARPPYVRAWSQTPLTTACFSYQRHNPLPPFSYCTNANSSRDMLALFASSMDKTVPTCTHVQFVYLLWYGVCEVKSDSRGYGVIDM
jgi:hypothetical protein